MSHLNPRPCSDCETGFTRRRFLQTTGTAALAGVAGSLLIPQAGLFAAPTKESTAETAVGRFYSSLSEPQRGTICFPFTDPQRQNISANWHVTKPTIGNDFYTADQRAMITEIVKGVTSEDGYERLVKQMEFDDGGINFYSVAMFGEPGKGAFEWEMTGRHLTLRADGDTVDKAAFGGPIVYGHGEEDPAENLFHYQTKATDEVFRSLSADQSKLALIEQAPKENAVLIQGPNGTFPGISVGKLSSDQQKLVSDTLKTLLAPYRQADVDEVMQILKDSGGVESLHMAFYKQDDLKADKVWDIWRIEGPSFVWHFRGAPHVHAYINVGAAKQTA